jgi:hypothetical protein
MKEIAGYLIAAMVFAALGIVCLGVSRVDRVMADAQQAVVTADYAGANAALAEVERYYQYVNRVPWIGTGPANDLQWRRATLAYWQRQYSALAPPDRTDPVADVPADNVPLQLIVANAVYRAGQPRAKDRASALAVLDATISAYRAVLNNAGHPEDARNAEDAAHNYEYAVRLRDEILKGRRRALPPPTSDDAFGTEGRPERAEFERQFQQYVPLEKEERETPAAGVSDPPPRKG